MSKRLVIESSDQGGTEIDYSSLSLREIGRRVRAYETKYGMSFTPYNRQFSCDDATPSEMTDIMDWEYLVEERATRGLKKGREKRPFVYKK